MGDQSRIISFVNQTNMVKFRTAQDTQLSNIRRDYYARSGNLKIVRYEMTENRPSPSIVNQINAIAHSCTTGTMLSSSHIYIWNMIQNITDDERANLALNPTHKMAIKIWKKTQIDRFHFKQVTASCAFQLEIESIELVCLG